MNENEQPGARSPAPNPDLADDARHRVAGDGQGRSGRIVGVVQRLKRLKGPIVAVAAVGAVLSGLVGYWNVYRTVRDSSVAPAATNAASANAAPLSIVVLPFANLTGDPSQDYFADGLTATLTVDLSQIEDAIVVDSATAQSYKGKSATAQQLGNALGVRFVLQGNVQRSGPRVRVNAQLADSLSNAQLWSETFEGNDADLLALQDRITAKIAASMGREMVNVAARNSELRRSDPTVTDLLLRARAQSDKPQSLANWQQVERLYRQALKIEPGHPKAMMELASALAFQASNFGSQMSADARQQAWREALALATQAHGIDPGNPEYFRVVAFHSTAQGDSAGERRAAEELMRVRPKWAYPYNVLGVSYMRAGEFDKAVELLKEAVALMPARDAGSDVFSLNLCRAYFAAGNYKGAIESCGKVITNDPAAGGAHFLLAMAYGLDGDLVRARAEAGEVRRLMPGRKWEADKIRAEAATADAPRRTYLESKVIPALSAAGLLE